MNRRRRSIILGILVLLLALSSGCGQKPQAAPNNGAGNAEANQGSVQVPDEATPQNSDSTQGADETNAPQQMTESIEVYFTDDQMLELSKESREISYPAKQDKYLAALKALQAPSNASQFSLWGKAEFHSADFKEGTVTVDLTLPDEARLGAGGEALALDALKNTLFQFDEVQAIDVLVDGSPVDTLMGHVELTHPLVRN
ncbi:GerMN domain-containing protein [Paenibacillus sp. MB22_1]|uniref:GerMN domain-containing protein n=1 Tax=unclassified Paenibacillus TaxID=185978 RepID=UPI0021A41FBE|nr:GerMN domain-containing protein [Paenibacillus sp. p3-SID1389]MCT2195530.1 GerMN domain-containing protein [Paenibacillus sp. p3-SID1389]